jgi:protease-4
MDVTTLFRTVRSQPDFPLVIELDLARGVISQLPTHPVAAFKARHAASMRDIRDGLRRAAKDNDVAGLAVHVGRCPLTPDQCDEIGALIADFGKHKPTIAWTESFGELGNATLAYRLASFAQQIWLQPTGSLGLQGVQLGITLLRGGLEKLHVEPQFAQRKEYKTAADQFAATEITAANREMTQRIADSILEDTVRGVAQRRHLDPAAVRQAVDHAPLTAEDARQAGLVDKLGYRDEVYAALRDRFGRPDGAEQRISLQYAHRYARTRGGNRLEMLLNRRKPAVGVIGVHGAITYGPSQVGPAGTTAGSDTICAHLREAGRDDSVKAVVVRIDSPGGSYIASDAIRREVKQLRATGTPVIASMGMYAASGGYFAAMGCDAIVANPTTLTGSIGVVAGKFVTAALVDRIGLIREDVLAGANAGLLSSQTPFDQSQWDALNTWLDEVYADFTSKAADDRGLSLDELEPMARGRVWTGSDAHARGLVDELGGMGTALDLAAERAGLDPERLTVRGVPSLPWLEQIRPAESSESRSIEAAIGTPSLQRFLTGGPEDRLLALAELAGLELPGGILSLPWRFRIG